MTVFSDMSYFFLIETFSADTRELSKTMMFG